MKGIYGCTFETNITSCANYNSIIVEVNDGWLWVGWVRGMSKGLEEPDGGVLQFSE